MGSLPLTITVEMFYSDQWNDVTNQVRGMPSDGFGIQIQRGRGDEEQDVDFGSCTMTINNRNGRFSPQNPRTPLYGLIGRNTPLRVTVESNIRFVGEIIEWPIRWDQYGKDVFLPLQAVGVLRRLTSGAKPIQSALRRHYLSIPQLTAYVPLEEPSDTFRDAGNLVPGTHGVRYVTSQNRRPGFGEGPHPDGSAPLPEWQPIPYFGWSRGASVIVPGPTGWWGIQVTAMVPPDSGEVWLAEWATDVGTYPWMALKVNSSGIIQIFGSDQADPTPNTFTHTYTSRGPIDDGEWRTITVAAQRNAADTLFTFTVAISTVTGQTGISQAGSLGNLIRIRPRPMFADPTDKEQLGLGHMAAVGEFVDNATVTSFFNNFVTNNLRSPVDGFSGESAVDRIRRLALEEEISVSIDYPVFVEDTFQRTEVNSLGTADSGQTWNELGTATNYQVNNGEGRITGAAPGIQDAVIPFDLVNGEALVKIGFSDLDVGGGFIVRRDGTEYYRFDFTFSSTGDLTYGIFDREVSVLDTASLDNALEVGWSPDVRWWIRISAVENRLQMKAWYEGEPEPSGWPISIISNLYSNGEWGIYANGSVEVLFDELTIWDACPSTLLGPQQLDTLVGNLRQAQDADHGILYETRDELGLTYAPLCSLYNQEATLELDYEACHLGHPLNPETDDRFLANNVTVQRIGGTSARVVKETGPLSVLEPPEGVGTYSRDEELNLFDDDEVEDHAGWLLHLGTWPEARYSLIRIRNQAPQSCELDPRFAEEAAAVDTGKVISITNPPIWLPPEDIRALVQGYEEEIDLYKWLFRFNASPANPYIVGEWDEEGDSPQPIGPAEPRRYDTCGSEITEGLVVTGASGGYARTLDAAVLDITGDIDIRAEVYHGTWRPGSERTMVAKYDDGTNNRSWRFALNTDGSIRFSWSEDGITPIHAVSDAEFPFAAARRIVRATLDVSSGDVRFFVGESFVGPWVQFGAIITSAPTSIFSSAANVEVGSRAGGTTAIWVGVIYGIEIRDGIGGTVVADPDFTDQATGTTSFTDDAGRPWQVLGAASIAGDFVAGTDTSMSVTAVPGPLWSTTATFPLDIQAAGVRLRVTAISGVSSPQTFTVEQVPVNGIEKTIPAGTPISLWQPARYAL